MNNAVLSLQDVARVYEQGGQKLSVFSHLDLEVRRGEVMALVGPSGCGKSTLLHIAGLLDTPNSGTVIVAGENVTGASDAVRTYVRRRQIGFVYQFHHLLPEFSALENVMLPQMIARALANDPPLLLADEPTGNLDPITAEATFALLLKLVRERGMAVLMATHNADLAKRMDRSLRLEEGMLKPA